MSNEIKVDVNTEAVDEWVAALRILVSQVGFAFDNYLASRPAPTDHTVVAGDSQETPTP